MAKNEKVAFVLFSEHLGGGERRIGYVFKALSDKYPNQYHFIVNKKVYDVLQNSGYNLEKYPNVHVLRRKSMFDFKAHAHQGLFIQMGRLFTLFYYRKQVIRLIKKHKISTIHVYLEMLRILGIFPIKKVKQIASIVTHLPIYFDGKSFKSKLMLRALKKYNKVDIIYQNFARKLSKLGIPRDKINNPRRNCVNHVVFKPEKKEKIVTFTARMVGWKNPLLLLDAISKTIPHVDEEITFYVMGGGPLLKSVQSEIKKRKLSKRVVAQFFYQPAKLVNKSLVHASIEGYDNVTNQGMLEGMASGCAIVASNVGLTKTVVTPDVGVLVDLSAKSISDALILLLNDRSLVRKMGKNSRKNVLKDHSISEYMDYLRIVQDFESRTRMVDGVKEPMRTYNDLREPHTS